MPLPLLLAPAAVAGVKTLYTALNKPKLREPKFMIEALDKQIANNSADIVNKTLMNVGTSAAKSAGARLYQQQERGIGQMAERGQLSEGQEAQALLEAGSNVQGVVGEQSQNLLMPQIDRNLQMKQQNDQSRLAIAQMKDEARQRLRAEKQQWQNELAGGIIDTATSTFSGIMQNIQDKKITDMVGGMLNGRNLTDLSDSELNGLMTSLYLAKLGIMPLASGGAASGGNKTGEALVPPEIPGVANLRADLDRMRLEADKAEGVRDGMLADIGGAPVPGNIDTNPANFPRVDLGNGEYGTVRTISIGTDQGEVLIPTIYDGAAHTDDEAVERYRQTGQHFGIYRTPEEATAAAEALHQLHQSANQAGTGKSYAEWQNLVNGGDMSAATISRRNIESFKERGFWLNARGQRVTTAPPGYSEVYGGQ